MLQLFPQLEIKISPELITYPDALAEMETRAAAVAENRAKELVWFLEHPPLYTKGTSAKSADLIDHNRFPVFDAGRGGQFTYHGPGQRLIYLVLNLSTRNKDIRCFVHALEDWIIGVLSDFGLLAQRRPERVGVWIVHMDGREEKIAALGVRVRKWVTMHGISLNIAPDLSHYAGIIPCGLAQYGVTSLDALGIKTTMAEVDAAFLRRLPEFLKQIAAPSCQT